MPKTISFKTTAEDFDLIAKVADRYQSMERQHRRDRMSIVMDFCAVQNSSTPLDLARMLEADDFNFAHDAFGIARHL
jgi:bisphosphoglycerate-independent phosphoglycerate mutase (AlkP superfamily)